MTEKQARSIVDAIRELILAERMDPESETSMARDAARRLEAALKEPRP